MAFKVSSHLTEKIADTIANVINVAVVYFTDNSSQTFNTFTHTHYYDSTNHYHYVLVSVQLILSNSKTVDRLELYDEDYNLLIVKDELNLTLPTGTSYLQEKIIILNQI